MSVGPTALLKYLSKVACAFFRRVVKIAKSDY